MKVKLKHVSVSSTGRVAVLFSCAIGQASANWSGAPPSQGQVIDVEFDVPGILRWGYEVTVIAAESEAISQRGNRVSIVARLTDMSEDGVATIQIENSAFLIETSGSPAPSAPCFVRIDALNLQLFPTDV